MKAALAAVAATLIALPALAAMDHKPLVGQLVEERLRADFGGPVVLASVAEQNAAHAGLDQAGIDGLDKAWRAEVEAGGPMVERVLGSALSKHLAAIVASYGGLVTEVFIMDNRGLNVGQNAKTSDYWQGDEAKFQQTYPLGAAAVFVDEVELDESTQTLHAQVSFTLVDAAGAPIGAVTVGVDVEALAQ